MKSKIVMLAVTVGMLICVQTESKAQSQGKSFYATPYKDRNSGSFSKGTGILSIGYGFGSVDNFVYNNWLWSGVKKRTIGPLYGKFELGIMDEVGVGIYGGASYSTIKFDYNSYQNQNTLDLGFGVVGYYHFNKFIPVEKLDVFAGIGLGFKIRSNSYPEQNNSTTIKSGDLWLSPAIRIGARYYFTDNLGAYLESGYDRLSSVNLGISIKF